MEIHDYRQIVTFRVIKHPSEGFVNWPAEKAIPDPWRDTGVTGTYLETIKYIRSEWKDMPRSMREVLRRLELRAQTYDRMRPPKNLSGLGNAAPERGLKA